MNYLSFDIHIFIHTYIHTVYMLCVLDLARLAAYFRPVCMFHSVYVCVCMYVSMPYSSNHFVRLLHELSSTSNAFVFILYIPVGAALC